MALSRRQACSDSGGATFAVFAAIVAFVVTAFASGARAGVVVVEGETFQVRAKIAFGSGSAELASSAAPILDEIAAALATYADIDRVVVEGHTDNIGDAERNRALSLARANAVVASLIARGVVEKRLEARGFGDTIPVADNDVAGGREKNRRVEFTILSRGGKATAVAGPIAKIAARFRDVEAKAPEEPTWQDGSVGTPLFRAWRVGTKERSSADVAFKDTSSVHLRETTLVIIFGEGQAAKKEQRRATLETGALVSRLDELLGGEPLAVDTPSGVVDLGRGSAVVAAKPKISTISNHRGDAVVVRGKTGKKTPAEEPKVAVNENWGTRVEAGKAPEEPTPLPGPPQLDMTVPTTSVEAGKNVVRVRWKPTGTTTIVEIRRAGLMEMVFEARVPAGVDSVEARDLAPGDYELRLAAVNDAGFESQPTFTSVTVVAVVAAAPPPPPPPPPRIEPPALIAESPADDPLLPIVVGAGLVVAAGVAVAVGAFAAVETP